MDVYEQQRDYLLKKLRTVLKRLDNVDKVIQKRRNEDNPRIIPISE